jgi:nucleotide-binding universal stress UspA family protein
VVAAVAADLADRLGVRLVLLEVSLPTIDGDPLRDDRHLRTLARDLDREVDTVRLPGYREWQPILEFARGDPTTILVTGRRPPSAAGRFVAGSVAINLARRSHGPLMIVPNTGEST